MSPHMNDETTCKKTPKDPTSEGSTMTITDFKKLLVEHLTSEKKTIENNINNNLKHKQHELEQLEGESKHKRRKMCKQRYKMNNNKHGRKFATNRTKKVNTYCKDCSNKHPLCLPCFNQIHTNIE
ncbi:uncharacterized protein LOC126891475 [Diabrotica virgifera virgifera]|uniref:Uncharacterized protein n=1 Tax=Diabrotica virgifera virgifera TaxID=50390 RepID=A0ABM5L2F2_DIAVI|nr:uncharacterized protein LOC126891475 [Diabrotica virgifera virgifera]